MARRPVLNLISFTSSLSSRHYFPLQLFCTHFASLVIGEYQFSLEFYLKYQEKFIGCVSSTLPNNYHDPFWVIGFLFVMTTLGFSDNCLRVS